MQTQTQVISENTELNGMKGKQHGSIKSNSTSGSNHMD